MHTVHIPFVPAPQRPSLIHIFKFLKQYSDHLLSVPGGAAEFVCRLFLSFHYAPSGAHRVLNRLKRLRPEKWRAGNAVIVTEPTLTFSVQFSAVHWVASMPRVCRIFSTPSGVIQRTLCSCGIFASLRMVPAPR